MLSSLKDIIPGSESWPEFVANRSGQFEARLTLAKVSASASLFFDGMAGSILPVASAHGEGRARFRDTLITGLCNNDGRVTIMMPHPERTLRKVNFSWAPEHWPEVSPWQRIFHNARLWVQ